MWKLCFCTLVICHKLRWLKYIGFKQICVFGLFLAENSSSPSLTCFPINSIIRTPENAFETQYTWSNYKIHMQLEKRHFHFMFAELSTWSQFTLKRELCALNFSLHRKLVLKMCWHVVVLSLIQSILKHIILIEIFWLEFFLSKFSNLILMS